MTDGVAIIIYRENGRAKSWSIGCDLDHDNEQTIRAHVKKWLPEAEFVRVEFVPAKPSRVKD